MDFGLKWCNDLRDAVRQLLRLYRCRSLLGAKENLNLGDVRQNRPNASWCAYLHRALVDSDTVELFGGLGSTGGLTEDDCGDSPALAFRAVGEKSTLDWADGSCKVFLKRRGRVSWNRRR